MSSDSAYESFLDKANAQSDESESRAQTQDTSKSQRKTVNTDVPSSLPNVDDIFVSDTDSEFARVALKHSGKGLVSESDLKSLLGHAGELEDVTDVWEKKGQYKAVLDKAKKAGNGKVKVYRVTKDHTRAEYYVLSVDEDGERVVGYSAESVES